MARTGICKMRNLLPLGVLIACGACGNVDIQRVDCGETPRFDQLSGIERQVLADAVNRNKAECGLNFSDCIATVQTKSELVVRIQTKVFDAKSKKCVPIIGGTWFERYSRNGIHQETLRSF